MQERARKKSEEKEGQWSMDKQVRGFRLPIRQIKINHTANATDGQGTPKSHGQFFVLKPVRRNGVLCNCNWTTTQTKNEPSNKHQNVSMIRCQGSQGKS